MLRALLRNFPVSSQVDYPQINDHHSASLTMSLQLYSIICSHLEPLLVGTYFQLGALPIENTHFLSSLTRSYWVVSPILCFPCPAPLTNELREVVFILLKIPANTLIYAAQ